MQRATCPDAETYAYLDKFGRPNSLLELPRHKFREGFIFIISD